MTISLSSNPAFSRANCSSTGKGVNKSTLNKSSRLMNKQFSRKGCSESYKQQREIMRLPIKIMGDS